MKRVSKFVADDGKEFETKQDAARHDMKLAFAKKYDEAQDGALWAGDSKVSGADLVEWLEENSEEIRKILKPHVPTPRPKKDVTPTVPAGAAAGVDAVQ